MTRSSRRPGEITAVPHWSLPWLQRDPTSRGGTDELSLSLLSLSRSVAMARPSLSAVKRRRLLLETLEDRLSPAVFAIGSNPGESNPSVVRLFESSNGAP